MHCAHNTCIEACYVWWSELVSLQFYKESTQSCPTVLQHGVLAPSSGPTDTHTDRLRATDSKKRYISAELEIVSLSRALDLSRKSSFLIKKHKRSSQWSHREKCSFKLGRDSDGPPS